MKHEKVIVFGPTGNVGAVTAIIAHSHGSHITLALRDTTKPIPGLDSSTETAGNYFRVQADLTQPDTVAAAVQKSGATAAFLYLVFGSPDKMLSTFQALQSAGIKHVVLLSSYNIQVEDLASIPPEDIIPYVHAQAEISLRKVFAKDQLFAIRPGGFATNVLHFKSGIQKGAVRLFAGGTQYDYITFDTMGEVSGVILSEGQRDDQDTVYLFGPEWVSMNEAYKIVGDVLGRTISTKEVSEEDGVKLDEDAGLTPPICRYFIPKLKERLRARPTEFEKKTQPKALENIKAYTGRESLGFKEWAQRHKDMFP